jgi:uncharacterized protein YjbI with pentapeptide repeats
MCPPPRNFYWFGTKKPVSDINTAYGNRASHDLEISRYLGRDILMSNHKEGHPFDGPQLQGKHYQRADMSDTNFDGVNLSGARFYAVMTNAKFKDTNLSGADFEDVSLASARFHDVNISGATITNANLSGLTIRGATLADAKIEDADLTGMRINGVLVSDLFDAYEQSKA